MILDLKRRLLFLLFVFIIAYFVFSVFSGIIIGKFGIDSTPAMRIVSVLQDILLFIIPSLSTAIFVTRRPASLLAIDKKPAGAITIIGICVLVTSIPVMNLVIWLNEQLPLPTQWTATFRSMEDNAQALVSTLQGLHTMPNLILSILIVGIFAGFSEELLFRGAFQRLMSTGGINPHAAIWIAAIVFSLLHMQIYGFIPRMLLGAFFGYALLWSGSLWTPIILHITNNAMYLIGEWFWPGTNDPHMPQTILIITSVAITCTLIFAMSRYSKKLLPSREV